MNWNYVFVSFFLLKGSDATEIKSIYETVGLVIIIVFHIYFALSVSKKTDLYYFNKIDGLNMALIKTILSPK